MADRVFFIAGSPEDIVRGVNVPPQMISDLLEISRIPPPVVAQIGASVEKASGFLDDARLQKLVKGVISDEKTAAAVVNALRNLRPPAVERTLSALKEWRDADPRHVAEFDDEALAAVTSNLPRLIRPSPALDRQRKARRLRTLTGHQGKEVEIVCDARPVFDRERTTIEGFVMETTLKLVYESQSEDLNCIEIMLSAKLLGQLLDKARKAKKKLQVLGESIERWIPAGLADSTLQIPDENDQ
ncbi:MAG TPA: hypothetical protein VKA15_08700 [Isosphaeraceae bacterium]|nr:hypothetical protein [Isosphaeraceae bacterium]